MRVVIMSLCLVGLLVFQSCGEAGGLTPGSGNTFEELSASNMTIDDIVTDASYPIMASPVSAGSTLIPFHLLVGATLEYYHGRYFYNNNGNLDAGRMSFKIVKQSNSTAYFVEWTVHRTIDVSDPSTWSAAAPETDLNVPTAYDSADNSIFINHETKRQVKFKINFGDNTHFLDIDNGIVVFSEDYTTMIGGDDRLMFIATRGTSDPTSTTLSDLVGSWGSYQFEVNNGTSIVERGLSSDTYGTILASDIDMTGINGDRDTNFVGEARLVDGESGFYIYAEDDLGINLSSVDGIMLMAPGKELMLRFDLTTDIDHWGLDKF